jgi:hypothetical protein
MECGAGERKPPDGLVKATSAAKKRKVRRESVSLRGTYGALTRGLQRRRQHYLPAVAQTAAPPELTREMRVIPSAPPSTVPMRRQHTSLAKETWSIFSRLRAASRGAS